MLHAVNGYKMPFYNPAKYWGTDAAAKVVVVDMNPAVRSIYSKNTGPDKHVAYV